MASDRDLTAHTPEAGVMLNGQEPGLIAVEPGDDAPLAPQAPRRKSLFRRIFRRPSSILAGCGLVVFVLLAIFGSWISPFDPNRQDLTATFQEPSSEHWFGTDNLGRDLLSRVLLGARVSLSVGLIGVALSLVLVRQCFLLPDPGLCSLHPRCWPSSCSGSSPSG